MKSRLKKIITVALESIWVLIPICFFTYIIYMSYRPQPDVDVQISESVIYKDSGIVPVTFYVTMKNAPLGKLYMTTYSIEENRVVKIRLYDNGSAENGDAKAGDGIYSYIKHIDTTALPDEEYQNSYLTEYRFDIKTLGEEYSVANGHINFQGEESYINSLIRNRFLSLSEDLNKDGLNDDDRLDIIEKTIDEFIENGYISTDSYFNDEHDGRVIIRTNNNEVLFLTYKDKYEIIAKIYS